MHTNQIYIARDGKSGMHVLVRILAVDDIGKDYLPIDPDDFNKLMMARDVRSLVLAVRDLGPMHISADILSRRTFIPIHLQQDIECGFNLIPPDLESLLSECYFDPYAIPDEIAGMGYRAIGRTGKKATRELINELDFTKAGDLSYLDSQFRAIVEPLHDWIFARNLLSILMRIGGLYRSGADPDTILEAARFRQVNPMVLKKRFDIDTDTCYAIPIAFNPIYRMENLADKDISFDALQFCPLYGSLIDKKNSFRRTAIEQHLKGPGNEFVKFLAPLEASRVKNRSDNHESHSGENKWRYMVVSSNTDGEAINSPMQLANRLLQAFDGILFQPQLTLILRTIGAQRCFKPNTLEPCITHYKPFKRDTFHFVVNLYLIRNLYIILLTVFGSNPLSDKTKGIGIIKRSFVLVSSSFLQKARL